MFLIGVAPVPAQVDVASLVGIGAFLALLLAIAIVLHVATAPRVGHDAIACGPSDEQLAPSAQRAP
jgi:hypothetical protein